MATADGHVTQAKLLADADDPAQLRAVNAQLESTIRVLRSELERERTRGETAVRGAHGERASEIAGLKETIDTLRARLESGQKAGDAAVQAVRAEANGEIAELRATIVTLRTELETERTRRANEASEQQQVFDRERAILEDQIRALRARLEASA